MARVILHHNPHRTPHELKIRLEATERPENGGDAQLGVIEPLAQHLDLNNHIDHSGSRLPKHLGTIVGGHGTVNGFGFVPSL